MASSHRLLDLTLSEVAAARVLGLAAVLRDLHEAETRISDLNAQLVEKRPSPEQQDTDADQDIDLNVLAEELARLRRDWASRDRYATQQTQGLADCHDLFRFVPELKSISAADLGTRLEVLDEALARLGHDRDAERATWVILESIASTALPKKMSWVVDKTDALRPSVVRYHPGLSDGDAVALIEELEMLHKRAKTRLTKDAMPPGMLGDDRSHKHGHGLRRPGV